VREVWKFPLSISQKYTEVTIPYDASILCVQVQYRIPTLWALVDPTEETTEVKKFRLVATGQTMMEVGIYIGTVQFYEGSLVYHVFEV
jgi:hypothetical protein